MYICGMSMGFMSLSILSACRWGETMAGGGSLVILSLE